MKTRTEFAMLQALQCVSAARVALGKKNKILAQDMLERAKSYVEEASGILGKGIRKEIEAKYKNEEVVP